jgi:hypothetical protein
MRQIKKSKLGYRRRAHLYLAYLIDSDFSIEATGSEYNDDGDVLETSLVIYKNTLLTGMK